MGTKQVRNSSGHLEPVDDEAMTDTAVVNEVAGLVFGDVIVKEAAGTIKKYDASNMTDCEGIRGISDGTYANGATATFYVDGALMPGFVGMTPGTMAIADPTTGALGVYADLALGEISCWMGKYDTATEFKISVESPFTR